MVISNKSIERSFAVLQKYTLPILTALVLIAITLVFSQTIERGSTSLLIALAVSFAGLLGNYAVFFLLKLFSLTQGFDGVDVTISFIFSFFSLLIPTLMKNTPLFIVLSAVFICLFVFYKRQRGTNV